MEIIAFLVGFYFFATRGIKNEPLKSHIDKIVTNTNNYLVIFKETKPSIVLDGLSNIAWKVMIYTFIVFCIVIMTFPNKWSDKISSFFAIVFCISALLEMSIKWNQKHKKTLKDIFFNFYTIVLLFVPTILYFIDVFYKINLYYQVFQLLENTIKINNIIITQLFWIISIVGIIYIGFWIISVPIYLLLYLCILTSIILIKNITRYMDIKVLDAIMSLLGLIGLFLAIFYK